MSFIHARSMAVGVTSAAAGEKGARVCRTGRFVIGDIKFSLGFSGCFSGDMAQMCIAPGRFKGEREKNFHAIPQSAREPVTSLMQLFGYSRDGETSGAVQGDRANFFAHRKVELDLSSCILNPPHLAGGGNQLRALRVIDWGRGLLQQPPPPNVFRIAQKHSPPPARGGGEPGSNCLNSDARYAPLTPLSALRAGSAASSHRASALRAFRPVSFCAVPRRYLR